MVFFRFASYLIALAVLVTFTLAQDTGENDPQSIAKVLLSQHQIEGLGLGTDKDTQANAERVLHLPDVDEGEGDSLRRKKKLRGSMIDPDADIVGLGLDASKVATFKLKSKKTCDKIAENELCGERCSCIDGKLYCCRQRRDWDDLSNNEKVRLLETIYDLAMGNHGPRLSGEYRRIVQLHERLWWRSIHDKLEFFPWHRIYLRDFENLLRKVDCRLTVPYWDWTKRPDTWWQSSIFDSRYFGSNLATGTARRRQNRQSSLSSRPQCPSNGFFSANAGFTDLQNRCLVRQFDYSIRPASYERIQTILGWSDFDRFESALRHEHGMPHFMVGGSQEGLFFSDRSAEDPLFFLHHSNVDYQWYQRQTRYSQSWKEYWGSKRNGNTRMSGVREKVKHAVNPFRIGKKGDLCVEYVEKTRRYEKFLASLKLGNLSAGNACTSPNTRFPDDIFTLFRTGESERKNFLEARNQQGLC